jgi:uncharacterized protein YcbK (DUF882 family)
MGVRSRSALEATNDDLRRLRKELARSGRPPLRLVIAGDPMKPVLTLTIPRQVLAVLGTLAAIAALALPILGWGKPARAFGALSKALHPSGQDLESIVAEPLPEIASAAPVLTPKFQADAIPEGQHFMVEIANTGKMIKVMLGGPAGEPDEASYRALRHELRCQRTGAESPIDPRLIELLYQIAVHSNSHIQIVSAFRAPLYAREHNFHTGGMAADIRVPGLDTAELRDLAKSLGARGVGYYPTVQFVHVDVRAQPYFWTDTSGHSDHSRDLDERQTPPDSSDTPDPTTAQPAPAAEIPPAWLPAALAPGSQRETPEPSTSATPTPTPMLLPSPSSPSRDRR